MKEFEAKYRAVLDLAKLVFSKFGNLTFCGGTALNTFYLNYRYSEDLDIGYSGRNPKSSIEEFLEANGCRATRTNMKIRDIVEFGGFELKMDVFEFEPILEIASVDLEGVKVNVPTQKEFILSKIVSFLTREDVSGLGRDAYDLHMLSKIEQEFYSLVKNHKPEIKKRVVSLSHNFGIFEERAAQVQSSVSYLLKEPVEYGGVLDSMKKLRAVLND